MIFCVYLPPDNSRYGQCNELILDKLTIEMNKYCDVDTILICGDLNARVGDKNDVPFNDDITKRVSIDKTTNAQGLKLLQFIGDIKGCIVNGRVTNENDDFTSVTDYKGKSVMDYHVTRQSDLKCIKSMSVLSCTELIAQNNWEMLISEKSRIPDHNLLSMVVELSTVVNERLLDCTLGVNNYKRSKIY